MASDRSMVNKFIVDSTAFYMKEYHLSGFRFDLMGLIDNQTMIDVYSSCKKIDPNAMIYGEPWTGGTTTLRNSRSSSNLSKQQTLRQHSFMLLTGSEQNVSLSEASNGMMNSKDSRYAPAWPGFKINIFK